MEELQPWDVSASDERAADFLNTFIIYCEDEHHEPLYFRSFEGIVPNLKINAIPNQKSKKLNINATIHGCVRDGQISFKNHKYELQEGLTAYIWCVYDRDMESEQWEQIPYSKHIDFDTSIITAESAGLRVAWSNDVFEMWILLHFEAMPVGQYLHRSYVYNRLTHIFKTELHHDEEMASLIANETFNYKDNMKRKDRFIKQVIPQLNPRIETAIKNAELLEARFNSDVAYHLRNPCTLVHHLVKEILAST